MEGVEIMHWPLLVLTSASSWRYDPICTYS